MNSFKMVVDQDRSLEIEDLKKQRDYYEWQINCNRLPKALRNLCVYRIAAINKTLGEM